MTPFGKRSDRSALIIRAAADMKIRNMSPRTIYTYTYLLARFEDFLKGLDKHPSEAAPEDIREYQLMLIEVKKLAWSSFNQAVCSLRFLYRYTLPRDWHVAMIPFGKKPKVLPAVLSHHEVERLLECVTNLKHRRLFERGGLDQSPGTRPHHVPVDKYKMKAVTSHRTPKRRTLECSDLSELSILPVAHVAEYVPDLEPTARRGANWR